MSEFVCEGLCVCIFESVSLLCSPLRILPCCLAGWLPGGRFRAGVNQPHSSGVGLSDADRLAAA